MLASPLYMRSREDCESSRMPIALGKPGAMFSSGNEEPGNQFKSSIFKNADPLNLGRSLFEGNKDHLLSQARSELMRQEHQVEALNNCAYAQRSELQDAQYGFFLNLDENKFVYKKQLSVKEKVLRDTQIRSMHEMGDMKRVPELRVDEVSLQKLKKS